MVTTAISLLYLVNVANASSQWFLLEKTFITDGATRGTAFATIFQTDFVQSLLSQIFSAIVFVIADGLLVRAQSRGARHC